MSVFSTKLAAAVSTTLSTFFNLFEYPLRTLQRAVGVSRMGWLFVGPNLFILALFTFIPILINVWYSVTGGVELMPAARPYVGAENFAILLECENYLEPQSCRKDIFWQALFNTAKFSVLQVSLMVFFALVTALVLNRKILGRSFWRGVFFYPVLLSPVVVALIWKWLLQTYGVFNAGLVGAGFEPVQWLIQRDWAFFWSLVVSIWAHMGFYTLILLAGLQAIPKDMYEAAHMDGASPWRTLWRITLPLLMPNLLVVIILSMVKAVQVFDEVFVLTGGGPGSATTFVVQYIYQTGFAEQIHLYGLAAAASLMLAGCLMALTLLQWRVSNRKQTN